MDEISSEVDFSAVHVHDLPLAKVGVDWAKEQGKMLILDLHENWPAMMEEAEHTNTLLGRLLSPRRKWRRYEKKMVGEADVVITVVKEMRDRIAMLTRLTDKLFIYQNVPELKSEISIEHRKRDINDPIQLIYVGGVTVRRGLQIPILGISQLKDMGKKVKLTVVGDGRYLTELKRLAGAHGLEEEVEFAGFKARNEAVRLMQEADIAIVPHLRSEQNDNSSPNKLFEYMQAGLPILCSDCLSLKRVIQDTKAGSCYRHDSPGDFAETLLNMGVSGENLFQMSQNGVRAVTEEYNLSKHAKNIQEAYNFIL